MNNNDHPRDSCENRLLRLLNIRRLASDDPNCTMTVLKMIDRQIELAILNFRGQCDITDREWMKNNIWNVFGV